MIVQSAALILYYFGCDEGCFVKRGTSESFFSLDRSWITVYLNVGMSGPVFSNGVIDTTTLYS